ncbi:hypothetical protein F5X97DRAFT_328070 [Nemania serpens]|nr:hypothetical protein F5X97DRAFT_328070 [Nemania serpens]
MFVFIIFTSLLAIASATPIFNASVARSFWNDTWEDPEIIPVTNMGCWSEKLDRQESWVATWKLAEWGRYHHVGAGAIHGEYYGLAATWICNCKHFRRDHVVPAELTEARKRLDFECGPTMSGWVWSKRWQKSINFGPSSKLREKGHYTDRCPNSCLWIPEKGGGPDKDRKGH